MHYDELQTITNTGFSPASKSEVGLTFLELRQYLNSTASLPRFKQEVSNREGYLDLVYSTVRRMKHYNRSRSPLTDEIEIIPCYSDEREMEVAIVYHTSRLTNKRRREVESAFRSMLEQDLGSLLETGNPSLVQELRGDEIAAYADSIEVEVTGKSQV